MGFDYFPFSGSQLARRKKAWDGLREKKSFGRPALVFNRVWDYHSLVNEIIPAGQIPLSGPAGKRPEWDAEIRNQLRHMQFMAASRFQDDTYPGINIPRHIYGQSQPIAEIFGCKLLAQHGDPNLYYPVPWIESAGDIDKVKIPPLEGFRYMKAADFVRYAKEITDGQLSARNPVMTGPFDTANYILGTMRLMEWIYEEPAALRKLLQIITDVLIEIIQRLQEAADGKICPEFGNCLETGFGLCSETRSLISAEACREFETPYLRQIGEACGRFAFHGCGSWERTLPDTLADPNLMLINFQTKEMDLQKVKELTNGNISVYIGRSVAITERYLWADERLFIEQIASVFNDPVPLELCISPDLYMEMRLESKYANNWLFE